MSRFPVPPPFHDVGDVVAGMCLLRKGLNDTDDRRGVFVTAYLEITRTLHQWLRRQRFHDNQLVNAYVTSFAELYRRAFADYEEGRRGDVPNPWLIAFDASCARTCSISQDLLLGINAHINHDLAFAILDARVNVESEIGYRDHVRINDALRTATPIIRKKIAAYFQPGHRIRNLILGRSIDRATGRAFEKSRQNAWNAAQELATANSEMESKRVSQEIEHRATSAARLILENKRHPTRCIEILKEAKQLRRPA